jgi:hypothetical protein
MNVPIKLNFKINVSGYSIINMSEYHFGVPGLLIWLSHILLGSYFVYLGYALVTHKDFLHHGIILIVIGAIAALYHLHLWYYEKYVEYAEAEEEEKSEKDKRQRA